VTGTPVGGSAVVTMVDSAAVTAALPTGSVTPVTPAPARTNLSFTGAGLPVTGLLSALLLLVLGGSVLIARRRSRHSA